MHLLVTFVAACVLAVGIYFNNNRNVVEPQILKQEEVLSEESEDKTDEESATPTNQPATETPAPTTQSSTINSNLQNFVYPNATTVSSSDNSINLQSSDTPEQITDWYREKILDSGMSVRSFVMTKTNDNVLNKLAGADSEREVNVEIQKDAGESSTSIIVSLE